MSRDFSIVTQFDLTCEEQWIVDLNRSVSFLGWGVGAIVIGWLADKYGRKILLFPSFLASIFITFITPFLPKLYLITLARTFSCFFIPGATLQSFILVSEIVEVKKRALAAILIYMAIPLAFCILVPQAYIITKWKLLCMVCSLPYLVLIAFYEFIPESIQWLRANGKTEEATNTIRRIAQWNRSELPSNMKLSIPTVDTSKHTSGIFEIFRTRKLAKCSLCCGYLWLTTGLGCYGLLLAADNLG